MLLISHLLQQLDNVQISANWSILTSIVAPLFAALTGAFFGALSSYFFTRNLNEKERKDDLTHRRLDQLYSPILGLKDKIDALNKTSVELHDTTSKLWQELVDRAQEHSVEAVYRLDDRWEDYEPEIRLGNRIFRETIIPYYERMIEIVRKNHWLADHTTLESFQDLVRFVVLWKGWLDGYIPREVIEKTDLGNENLKDVFMHLESQRDYREESLSKHT